MTSERLPFAIDKKTEISMKKLLQVGLTYEKDDFVIDSLEILSRCPKETELVTPFELDLFRLFLTQNLKNSKPAARQELSIGFARFILRVCDSARRYVCVCCVCFFIYLSL
jgi:hypothetical protein